MTDEEKAKELVAILLEKGHMDFDKLIAKALAETRREAKFEAWESANLFVKELNTQVQFYSAHGLKEYILAWTESKMKG